MALPETAAASGTVASTSSWPGSSTSLRLVRFSDWLRKGTVRNTIGPCLAASAFSMPRASPSLDPAGRLLGAAGVARADDHGHPGAGPAGGQAEAERARAADDRDGLHYSALYSWTAQLLPSGSSKNT